MSNTTGGYEVWRCYLETARQRGDSRYIIKIVTGSKGIIKYKELFTNVGDHVCEVRQQKSKSVPVYIFPYTTANGKEWLKTSTIVLSTPGWNWHVEPLNRKDWGIKNRLFFLSELLTFTNCIGKLFRFNHMINTCISVVSDTIFSWWKESHRNVTVDAKQPRFSTIFNSLLQSLPFKSGYLEKDRGQKMITETK